MPIYEYSCVKCGTRLEVMQKITDKPLKRCKSCGGKLEKEWSTSSFQLKGSGWYVTDYAGKKSGVGEKEAGVGESASQTEGASETKAGAKAVPAATETKTEPSAAASAPAEETKRKKTSRPAATSNGSKRD
jgi:putative FmdB family regulatory protein